VSDLETESQPEYA